MSQQATLEFLREVDLVGQREVTPEQAAANRSRGEGPKRPRPFRRGMVPFSSATLWRLVKAGDFPQPVKLGERITAWRSAVNAEVNLTHFQLNSPK